MPGGSGVLALAFPKCGLINEHREGKTLAVRFRSGWAQDWPKGMVVT